MTTAARPEARSRTRVTSGPRRRRRRGRVPSTTAPQRVTPWSAKGDGWWRWRLRAAGVGHGAYPCLDYALPPRRRRPARRTRARAWQPHGVHGAEPHLRRRRHTPGATPPGPAPQQGAGVLGGVVYELHVGTFTPEGTFDAAVGAASTTSSSSASTSSSSCRSRPSPARWNWGYDGVAPVRRARRLRRPGGPPALRRRLPRARARGLPRRRLQPPRARRATTSARSGPTSPTPTTTPWGPARQPRRRRQPRGAPLDHRQRAALVRATSTSTPCGSTPSTSCATTPSAHVLAAAVRRGRGARRARSAGRSTSSPRATSTTPRWSPRPPRAASA